MKKLNLLFIAAVILVLGTAFISLTSSASSGKKPAPPTCKEQNGQSCELNGSGELIMESMSRQFIAISPL